MIPAAQVYFFFSSRRRHTIYIGDWSSDVCSSDLANGSRARAWQKALAVKARAGQQGDVGQGRVAVENLDEEPVDNGRWGQEATVAPRVACLAAGVVDEVATELGGEVLPEGVEGGR